MKLALIGSALPGAIEHYYLSGLKESGCCSDVWLVDTHGLFYRNHRSGLLKRIKFRIRPESLYDEVNRYFVECIKQKRPTHALVFKGMELYPCTLRWAREQGIKLINYNPDNPFLFSGRGSGNQNITDSISLYDLHLTYNLSVLERLKKMGCTAEWLPFAFDGDELLYAECARIEEINKVCFVGNPDKIRHDLLIAIARSGIPVDAYGGGWKIRHNLVTVHEGVYGLEYWKTLRKYRIQLNPLRPHNLDSHAMRSFEVPGIGGIMLAPLTREHSLFFEEGKEAFFYSDSESCIDRIRYVQSMTRDEAGRIRANARARSLAGGYDYKSRARVACGHIMAC